MSASKKNKRNRKSQKKGAAKKSEQQKTEKQKGAQKKEDSSPEPEKKEPEKREPAMPQSGQTGTPGREFSQAGKEHVEWLLTRYTDKVAALLPVLRLAEEEFGVIDNPAVMLVARTIGVSPGYVFGVLTFYTHYRRAGDGKYSVQVCSTISCALRGCRDIQHHLEKTLGIEAGETTEDGKFTLKKVECLGSCDTAPVVQINETYHENQTPETLDAILAGLE